MGKAASLIPLGWIKSHLILIINIVILIVVFALSRLLAFTLGLRFWDTRYGAWQILHPQMLQENLWQNLYYLHSQPPLFNLITGILGNITLESNTFAELSHKIYIFIGLVCLFSIFFLLLDLNVSRPLALLTSIGFTIAPATILFENFYLYDYPATMLLLVASYSLYQYTSRQNLLYGAVFFASVAALCLLRSFFHLGWLILIVGAVWWLIPQVRRRTLYLAALPVLLVFALYAKNLYVFGFFGSSSWLGMNLWRVSSNNIELDKLNVLADSGVVSNTALVRPFSDLDQYDTEQVQRYQMQYPLLMAQNLPVLTERTFNHIAYIPLSQQYLQDSIALIQHSPEYYIAGVETAFTFYFFPSSNMHLFNNAFFRGKIEAWDCFVSVYVHQQNECYSVENPIPSIEEGMSPTLLIVLPFLVVYGTWRIGIASVYPQRNGTTPELLVLGFIITTIVYVTIVGNFLEIGENQRFRFMINPFYAVLLALLLQDVLSVSMSLGWHVYRRIRDTVPAPEKLTRDRE